jgi:hypothetical protein
MNQIKGQQKLTAEKSARKSGENSLLADAFRG